MIAPISPTKHTDVWGAECPVWRTAMHLAAAVNKETADLAKRSHTPSGEQCLVSRAACCKAGHYRAQHLYRKAGKSIAAGTCQVQKM